MFGGIFGPSHFLAQARGTALFTISLPPSHYLYYNTYMMVKPNGYGWSAAAATGLVDGGYSDRAGRQDWWLAQRAAVSQGQGEVDDATNEVNEGETTAQLALEDLDFTDDISKILAEPKDLAAATSSPKGCGKSRKKGRTSSSSSSGWPWVTGEQRRALCTKHKTLLDTL